MRTWNILVSFVAKWAFSCLPNLPRLLHLQGGSARYVRYVRYEMNRNIWGREKRGKERGGKKERGKETEGEGEAKEVTERMQRGKKRL